MKFRRTSVFFAFITLFYSVNGQAEISCHSNQFKCKSGKCIPAIWRCDGGNDCGDKSDEAGCPPGCGHGTFLCSLSNKCISQHLRCDGKNDCESGEDESDCNKGVCKKDQFRCHTDEVECIPKSQVCDYTRQCSDGSDEIKESCDQSHRIFKGNVCDKDFFSCKSDGLCLDKYYQCDGNWDCDDKSDELKCNKSTSPPAECQKGQYQCFSGQCLPPEKRCDSVKDCTGGDDELGCKFECEKNMSKCPNENKCINSTQTCNGVVDCIDKSDEANCTSKEVRKYCDPKSHFDCDGSGKECIPWSDVCNKKIDCKVNLGADEKHENCSKNECDKDNGGCSHQCVFDIHFGSQCKCPKGYRIDPENNKTCIDVDECKEWGTCSQYCINRQGGYQCGCADGFVSDINTKRCVATGEKTLMFTAQKDVREYKFSHAELRSVVHGLKNAVGFDIHQNIRPRKIYWSNNLGKIYETKLTSSGPEHKVLLSDSNSVIDGLMLDWTNHLLYWTDTGLNRIAVMNLTSGEHAVLLEGKKWMDEPRSIVLDPKEGWLYWSDWSDKEAKISMMGMDGTGHAVLVDKNVVQYPNALALDSVNRRLYYGDAKLNKIGCIDLNTRSHRNILVNHPIHPFAMTVFEDRVYWSDWRANTVFSVDKFTGQGLTRLTRTPKPMTLRMIHPFVQLKTKARCNGHSCSHICLPSPGKQIYSCACPSGMRLAPNRRHCIGSKTKSMKSVNSRNEASAVLRQTVGQQNSPTYLPNVGMVAGITMGVIITVAVAAAITGVVLYGKYSRRARSRTMNFDNFGMVKTSEDLWALTRSNSSMRSLLKTVPSSAQPLWTYETNNDMMDEYISRESQLYIKV